jgi:pimeloyl-ACP methyl ester carboxylesterase
METYLLVAIDGTSSRDFGYSGGNSEELKICAFNESHTKAFHRKMEIPGTLKYFDHGPSSKVTGSDCEEIEQKAWQWLRAHLRRFPRARVVLVGHSRGGHIVTNLAIRLSKLREGDFVEKIGPSPAVPSWRVPPDFLGRGKIEPLPPVQTVYFLGLYDAVDMTYALGDTSVVPANVVWFYHALRSERIASRKAWGNTATQTARIDKEHYFQQPFEATHGAIGGAFPEDCRGTLNRDLVIGAIALGVVGYKAAANVVGSCAVPLTAKENAAKGASAHEWLLGGARQAGLPIK